LGVFHLPIFGTSVHPVFFLAEKHYENDKLILGDENFPDHKHEDAKAAVMGLEIKELIKMHDHCNKEEPVNQINVCCFG